MRTGQALTRAVRNLRRHGARSALLIGGVALGVALLVFLLAFVSGTRRALLDRVVSSIPITHIVVVPKAFSLSVLRFESPLSNLDDQAIERIAALEGVERVMPMAGLKLPAQMRANFFGRGFVTDTGVFGIEPDLVVDQLPEDAGFEAEVSGVIPAVISSDLIDMYNTGFAKANDLPQLTTQILNGQRATLVIGSSSFNPSPTGAVRRVPIRIVGVSDRVPLVGVSLPLSIVNRWNRDLVDEDTSTYIQLNVVAERAQDVDEIAEQVESIGYAVATGREIASRVRTLTDVLQAAFGLIGLVVLVVAGIGIANATALSIMERRHEIGVFRSVGASRNDIRVLFLAEAALLGLVGSAIGVIVAIGAARVADVVLERVLPAMPLLPETYFWLSWPIVIAGLSLGFLVSVVAAVSPALRAARMDPARVLRTT